MQDQKVFEGVEGVDFRGLYVELRVLGEGVLMAFWPVGFAQSWDWIGKGGRVR